MIAKLICALFGHKRGKRVDAESVACPRCTSTWARKRKTAKAAA